MDTLDPAAHKIKRTIVLFVRKTAEARQGSRLPGKSLSLRAGWLARVAGMAPKRQGKKKEGTSAICVGALVDNDPAVEGKRSRIWPRNVLPAQAFHATPAPPNLDKKIAGRAQGTVVVAPL